jgi:flagellar biosynthesis protein FliR
MIEILNSTLIEAIVAFARIAGCFMLLPGFSSVRVPQQIRVIFVLALTISLLPFLQINKITLVTFAPADLVRILFFETIIGAVLGLSVRYYILAVSFVTTAASSVIGFNMLVAPSVIEGDMEPALATLMSFAALLAIFSMNFHHDIILALAGSYRVVPVGTPVAFGSISSDLTRVLSDSFLILLRLGSPFIAYAIIANLFVALLNKLTPNLQLYFIATPAVLFGGLIVAYFTLPAFISFIAQGLQTVEPFK